MFEREGILKGQKHFFGKRTVSEVRLEFLRPLARSNPPLQHNIWGKCIIARPHSGIAENELAGFESSSVGARFFYNTDSSTPRSEWKQHGIVSLPGKDFLGIGKDWSCQHTHKYFACT